MINNTRKIRDRLKETSFSNFSKSPQKPGHQSLEIICTRHLCFVDQRLLGFLRAKNEKRFTVAGRIGFPYLTQGQVRDSGIYLQTFLPVPSQISGLGSYRPQIGISGNLWTQLGIDTACSQSCLHTLHISIQKYNNNIISK